VDIESDSPLGLRGVVENGDFGAVRESVARNRTPKPASALGGANALLPHEVPLQRELLFERAAVFRPESRAIRADNDDRSRANDAHLALISSNSWSLVRKARSALRAR
jgi:hypothetical protein